jgi:predicted nuclease with RNAse H fold
VITAGVDLAAQPERTAVAIIKWSAGRAVIEDVACRADDEDVLKVVKLADKTGIDCPLGWPAAFVSFVTAHHAGHIGFPAGLPSSRRDLTMRRTDMFVKTQLRLTPLSVSADRIAHVALRCAILLAKIEALGDPVDRSGSGSIAEVYPAASLRSWGGLIHQGYKQKAKADVLSHLVDRLVAETPWLDCATHEQTMRRSHDVFDAVIAAMTARAAAVGQTLPPAGDDLAAATAEGWIAIPGGPIKRTAVEILQRVRSRRLERPAGTFHLHCAERLRRNVTRTRRPVQRIGRRCRCQASSSGQRPMRTRPLPMSPGQMAS